MLHPRPRDQHDNHKLNRPAILPPLCPELPNSGTTNYKPRTINKLRSNFSFYLFTLHLNRSAIPLNTHFSLFVKFSPQILAYLPPFNYFGFNRFEAGFLALTNSRRNAFWNIILQDLFADHSLSGIDNSFMAPAGTIPFPAAAHSHDELRDHLLPPRGCGGSSVASPRETRGSDQVLRRTGTGDPEHRHHAESHSG